MSYRYVKITPPPVVNNNNTYTPYYGNTSQGGGGSGNNKKPGHAPKPTKPNTGCKKNCSKPNYNKSYFVAGSSNGGFKDKDACTAFMPGRLCSLGYSPQEAKTSTIDSNELLGQVIKTEYSNNNYIGVVTQGYDQYQKYADYTYSYETQTIKVAEADLSSGTYATEFAAMPKISLTPGSAGDMSISTTNTGFWESTTPRYWTNHGTSTISNNSGLPYHFESESTAGSGVNTINVYASIQQKDKLYTLIHGYPNITDVKIPGVPAIPGFPPDQDETCAEVGNTNVCSKKETPLIEIEIKLPDNDPQGYEKIDKKYI